MEAPTQPFPEGVNITAKFDSVYIECLEEIRRNLQVIKADIHISRTIFYLLLKQIENPKELLNDFLEIRENLFSQIKDVDPHVLVRQYEDYAKLVQGWVDVIQENRGQEGHDEAS